MSLLFAALFVAVFLGLLVVAGVIDIAIARGVKLGEEIARRNVEDDVFRMIRQQWESDVAGPYCRIVRPQRIYKVGRRPRKRAEVRVLKTKAGDR